MVDKLLYAYEQTKKEKTDGMVKTLKKMSLLNKIFFFSLIGSYLFLFISCFFNIILIGISFMLFIAIIIVMSIFIIYYNRKNWKDAVNRYNLELDMLKEVLCLKEFDMYNKKKIKQIIKKINRDIDRLERKYNGVHKKIYNIINWYFVPVIAFFAGRMFRENIEWQIYIYALVFSIILICSILVGKYMLSYIYVQIFEENMLERKTDLANKLQDLYDRDFMEDVLYKSDMYN